ncbi:N-acetyltransferase [Bacteriovorax sp. Seq25_V]|uniref:GNAT family N-acetyltransferase n=1 Tax=Bacteriovorax sp. Seq25_V TaxID=1201288 RepID=UPI00038A251A|nr:N-acetyltransferase [Bacteriovorax sp. Seq25_V]EQC44289.1 FR47-like protein [Bacteriovorax sp. Seq25_V]
MNIEIKTAAEIILEPQLIEEIFDFDKLYFNWPWTKQNWLDFFRTRTESFIVLINVEDTLSGFCLIENNDDISYLHKICVAKNAEGHGHGQALMTSALSQLDDLKVNALSLEVDVSNFRAISFYEKLGFKQLGRRKKFYSDGSDAFVYELSLTS